MNSSKPGRILVVGSLNMDMVVRVHHHPQAGETVVGDKFSHYPGGKGANQAVAAARLGGTVGMIGKVGTDRFGDELIRSVAGDGVDAGLILRDDTSPTGVAMITVDDDGENTIVVASGANAHLEPEDISRSESAFRGVKVLLVQLECSLSTVERAMDIAREHGARVILDPAPAQLLDADLLKKVDYLTPNRTELALLSGQESIDAGIEVLKRHGAQDVIVTLGSNGATIFGDQGMVHVPAYRVPAVDTTAAGDAFAGALAVALMRSMPIEEAVKWGNAAGALSVMKAGAQPSLPTIDELDRFLDEFS
jgi:ribokinase